jgi:hypothetical protein
LLPILRRIGPGVALSASIVGSGELIATTTLRAQVGRAFCRPTDKFDGTAGFFLSFRGPIVMEWSAVHRELELACGFDLSSAWHVRAH